MIWWKKRVLSYQKERLPAILLISSKKHNIQAHSKAAADQSRALWDTPCEWKGLVWAEGDQHKRPPWAGSWGRKGTTSS